MLLYENKIWPHETTKTKKPKAMAISVSAIVAIYVAASYLYVKLLYTIPQYENLAYETVLFWAMKITQIMV